MTQGSYQANGSSRSRAARRAWLIKTYRADQDLLVDLVEIDGESFEVPVGVWPGRGSMACRCYRCGRLLTEAPGTDWHVTVDRVIPGCRGGTYRRNNIRPACFKCNSEVGGGLRR